jgi:hypothetical protein
MGLESSRYQGHPGVPYSRLEKDPPPYYSPSKFRLRFRWKFYPSEMPRMSEESRARALELGSSVNPDSIAVAILMYSYDTPKPNIWEGVVVMNRATITEDVWKWIDETASVEFGRIFAIDGVHVWRSSVWTIEKRIFKSEKKNGKWAELCLCCFDYQEFQQWRRSWSGKMAVSQDDLMAFLNKTCPVLVNPHDLTYYNTVKREYALLCVREAKESSFSPEDTCIRSYDPDGRRDE